MTKIRFRADLRIPSKIQYGFFHLPDIDIEVDVPKELVAGYPNCDIMYLTLEGLAYLEKELTTVLREQKVTDYTEEDVEEGW